MIRNLRMLTPTPVLRLPASDSGLFWGAVLCLLIQFFFANNVVRVLAGRDVNMRVHPADVLILFYALYALARGNMTFHQRCRDAPALILFVFAIPLFAIYTIYFNGISGAAFYWDSFWGPGLLALTLQGATPSQRRLLAKIVIVIVVGNVLFALFESVTHYNVFPFVANDDIPEKEIQAATDFRANAFYPHPLSGSLITGMAFFLLYTMRLGFFTLAPSFVLMVVGLLAFGGRTALFVTLGMSGLAAMWITAKGIFYRNLKLSTMSYLLMAAIVLPIVVAIVVTQTSIAERIIDTLYFDDSAEVRVIQWVVLNLLSFKEWLFGVPLLTLEALKYQIGLGTVEDIENFWLLLFLNLGVVGFIPFLVVFGLFLKYIAETGGGMFGWMLMLAALMIDTSSNSLGQKSADLFIEVAFLVGMSGYKNYQPFSRTVKQRIDPPRIQRLSSLAQMPNHAARSNLAGQPRVR